ncbi:MAG TPA: hypothetical protein VFV85_09630 [Conexibacter sp.]|nr:hypothetical protein [Conexibacter sp.]
MSAILQVLGALLVLLPFTAVQLGRTHSASNPYLVSNLLGSGTLAVLALLGSQWGFLLLEGVWAAVTLRSLARRARGLPVTAH